jgi:long-chain acyl-CoA synthetase
LRRLKINVSRRIFRQIIDELGGNLKIVITGAAALSPEINRAFEEFGIIVLQGYGMTECTPLISGTPMSAPRERYRKAGSVGVPVATGEIRLINQDENGIGEVLFRGPNVTMGYYKMPEETAKVLDADGWLHTGDLGYMEDGWLYLTGRCKNVIVTKTGENVYPEEIEEVINASPYVEDCMVFPYDQEGQEIVGIQILPQKEELREKLGREPSEEEIEGFMAELIREKNQELAVYKRIRKVIVRREDFVRTTTRKIKRQENMPV